MDHADHQIGIQINNNAQKKLAFMRPDLGDVRNLFGFRLQCREIPLQMIVRMPRPCWPLRRLGRGTP